MINIEEKFNEVKEMETFIMDNQIAISRRPDSYLKIRQSYKDFYGKYPTHGDTLAFMDKLTELAKSMKEIVQNWCYEQFAVEAKDFVDPYADLIRTVDDCKSQQEVFEALVFWATIRPYGERAERLNATILETYDSNRAEAEAAKTFENAEEVSEYAKKVEAEVNGNNED